jgi:hypothetical protein
MEAKYLRYYDPQTVSNRFAPGERIEWKNLMWESGAAYVDTEFIYLNPDDSDYGESTVVECATGIIKKIMPLIVIITIDHPNKEAKNVRLNKEMLARLVLDPQLKKTIETSMGQDISEQKVPKQKTSKAPKIPKEPKMPDDTPHDVYRLRDPRDKVIFYVGISRNVRKRYGRHLSCAGLNFKLNIRIQEIRKCGLAPELELIETNVIGTNKAREREKYWINHHVEAGDILTNIAEMDDSVDIDVLSFHDEREEI